PGHASAPVWCRTRHRACTTDRRDYIAASADADRGGVAEWLKAHAWKVCIRETVSGVRIPLPPPQSNAESVQGPRLGPFFFLFQRALAAPSALRRPGA